MNKNINNGGRNTDANDPYARQYEQQLREFSRIAGEDHSGGGDLSMHSIDETFAGQDNYYNNYNGGYYQGQPQNGQYGGQYQDGQYQDGQYGGQQRRSSGSSKRQSGTRVSGGGGKRSSGSSHKGSSSSRAKPAVSSKSSSSKKKSSAARKSGHYNGRQLEFGSNSKVPAAKNEREARKQSKKMADAQYTYGGKKSHPVRTFFTTVLILILVLFIGVNVLLYSYVSKVNIKHGGQRTYTSASMKSDDVKNILIIGSDTRDEEQYGRTDSMILLSINKSTKKITMTSFMRDMYVNIKGNDLEGEAVDFRGKMNSAYVYGGAELLMDTIEYNFDISVDDYVYIDFISFVDIIDSIGGIELTVTDEEAQGMKAPMAEQNNILGNKKGTDYLTGGGKLNLNGNQALAYARLRYVGNADFQRTERQREVITKIIEKVKGSNPLVMHDFAKTTCSDLTTNMSRADMMFMVYKALFSMNYEMNSLRIPAEGDYTYGDHDGQSTLDVDLEACRELLRKEIYG